MKNVKFYIKPFLIITFLNILFWCLFGNCYDSYEGMISTMLQGTYYHPIANWWSQDIHFLTFYIYELIAAHFPSYDIYGIILTTYNFVIITFLGLVIYRVLVVNLLINNLVLFALIYTLICLDNFINLNSTRQAFVLIAAIFSFIESRRFENKIIRNTEWISILFAMVIATLLRFQSVFLFSLIYITLLLIYRRFVFSALLSFFISGFVLVVFSFLISSYSSEAKQVFTYKEKEILVRDNIEYEKLSGIQLLEVQALKDYLIADEIHYKLKFYDSISKHTTKNGFLNIFAGLKFDFLLKTLARSKPDFLLSLPYFIFYILSGMLIFLRNGFRNKRLNVHYCLLIIIPFLLALHSVVALRFLIPFFTAAATLNLFLYAKTFSADKYLFALCTLFVILFLYCEYNSKKVFLEDEAHFKIITQKLQNLNNKQHSSNPIIIYTNFTLNYFPAKPQFILHKQNALFFNFYLFSSDKHHVDAWYDQCHCNTLSVKEKIEYMVEHQNLFIVDEKTILFLKKYMRIKYSMKIDMEKIGDFDGDFIVCKIKFVQ